MGGRVMRLFLRHFVRSLGYVTGQPLAWLVLPAAACLSIGLAYSVDMAMSLFHAPALLSRETELRLSQWMLLAFESLVMGLALLWYAIVATLLPSSQTVPALAAGGVRWAVPALPIPIRTRALAEASAALLLIFVVRIPLWLWVGGHIRAAAHASVGSGWEQLLGLPLLLAWLGSHQNRRSSLTRLLAAYGVSVVSLVTVSLGHDAVPLLPYAFALVPWSLMGHVALLPLILVITAAVLYSIGRRPTREAAARHPGGMRLHRPPSRPVRRFWTDVVRRSLPLAAATLLPGLTFALTGFVYAHARSWARDELTAGLAATLGGVVALVTTVLVVAGGTLHPLLLPLVSFRGLFSGSYCASWSWLPVRPQTIRRVVYAHALLVPLLVERGCGASIRAVNALSGTVREMASSPARPSHAPETSAWLDWMPWVLGLACWAGWALCLAVGDRLRGALAAVGIGLSLGCIGLTAWIDVAERDSAGRFVVAALLLGGAALLAALPLVHLSRARRVA